MADFPATQRWLLSIAPPPRDLHLSFSEEDVRRTISLLINGSVKAVQCFHLPAKPAPEKQQKSMPFAAIELQSYGGLEALANLNQQRLPPALGGCLLATPLQSTESPESRAAALFEQYVHGADPGRPASRGFDRVGSEGESVRSKLHAGESNMAITPQESAPTYGNNPYMNGSAYLEQSAYPTNGSGICYLARLELIDLFSCEDFNITHVLVGEKDCNIHYILAQSENKASISLKGVPSNEAPVAERLHMSISAVDKPFFDRALDMAEDLLQAVCSQFVQHCLSKGVKISPRCGFVRHVYHGILGPNGGPPTSFKYLGLQERPRIWLHDLPPGAISASTLGRKSEPPKLEDWQQRPRGPRTRKD